MLNISVATYIHMSYHIVPGLIYFLYCNFPQFSIVWKLTMFPVKVENMVPDMKTRYSEYYWRFQGPIDERRWSTTIITIQYLL